jgi:heat shock protein HslJ
MIATVRRLPTDDSRRLEAHEEHDLKGDWLVVEIYGETVDPEAPRQFHFEADRIAGRVGVNRFTGSITMVGDVVQVGPVASTRMAGPPDLMALEDRFNYISRASM